MKGLARTQSDLLDFNRWEFPRLRFDAWYGRFLNLIYWLITHRAIRSLGLKRIVEISTAKYLPAFQAVYADMTFEVKARDTMYSSIYVDGAYERFNSQLITSFLRPGDVCVDIGANHGFFTCLMASRVGPKGLVVGIEPMPEMIRAWKRNAKLNPNLNCILKTVALGCASGTLKMYEFEALPHGHASSSDLGRNDARAVNVPVTALDDIVTELGVRPTFIKMDVEGSELNVLRGAECVLTADCPPAWLLEVNAETSAAFGYKPADLVREICQRSSSCEVLRIEPDGRMFIDLDIDLAPHGSTWLVLPDHLRDRLA